MKPLPLELPQKVVKAYNPGNTSIRQLVQHGGSNTNSPKICYNRTQARKEDCMKVNYQGRIEDTVTELKIIMSQQRTVTRQTKSSGTLFVKIWW